MTAWDELKIALATLRDQQPHALASYPSPDSDLPRMPPFKVGLAAWAADAAGELQRQFGDDVELTVGFLPYPPGRREPRRRKDPVPPSPELLSPREVTVALDGPAVVRSGETLSHQLIVRNHTASELQIATNGSVTASVVDPPTGEIVGGYCGAHTLALRLFRAAPGGYVRIPLRVGTASSRPALGYAVPAGEWGIQVTLKLGPDPRERRTPVMPLTVTA